ncbi:hypothetical protein [Streptomyces sp. NPDC050988]|uniref:hypothetical protein n=1 Tax=Streptomyces sp. NPDC050988 TaxID=3365637 RepID=UPI003787F0E7
MSLPAIAIIVASLSALFTMSNMLISAATYRRGGPRIKLRAFRLPLNAHLAMTTGEKRYLERVIHVHVVNRSASSITIESVHMEPLYALMERLVNWTTITTGQPWGGDLRRMEFIEGEEKKEIPPFGGARWILREPKAMPEVKSRWLKLALVKHPHVTVKLTNGAEVRSRKVSNWRVRGVIRTVEIVSIYARNRNRPDFMLGASRDVQLSFDDIQEEES